MAVKKSNFLKNMLAVSKNKYASIASDGVVYDPTGWIDSGNLLLNAQLSGSMFRGMASNMTCVVAGDPGVGKTYFVLGMVKHFLDSNENSYVIYFESEGSVKKETLTRRDIDTDRVAIVPIVTVEELKNQMSIMINEYEGLPKDERPKVMFCLDSLGQLSFEKELEDAAKGHNASDMGGRAKGIKSAFRALRLKCSLNDFPFLVTAHVYESGGMFSSKVVGGGKAHLYAGDSVIMLGASKIKEGEEIYDKGGSSVRCKAQKSRDTRPQTETSFVIDFMRGVTKFSGLFDFCYEHGMVKKDGTRYFVEGAEDNKMFKKNITEIPEKFFTQQVLELLDKKMESYFNYGSPVERLKAHNSQEEETEE